MKTAPKIRGNFDIDVQMQNLPEESPLINIYSYWKHLRQQSNVKVKAATIHRMEMQLSIKRKTSAQKKLLKDLTAESSLSDLSYSSVQKYKRMTLNEYVEVHPITDVLHRQSWNNIPLPLKELIECLGNAIRGQDMHMWERKYL